MSPVRLKNRLLLALIHTCGKRVPSVIACIALHWMGPGIARACIAC